MSLKLLFIQLNEINFDIVEKYISLSEKISLKILKHLEIILIFLILLPKINMKI